MPQRTTADGRVINVKMRATRIEIEERRTALIDLCVLHAPATVRGIFYRATVAGLVDKTEQGYSIVQQALVDLRKGGAVSYDDIIDPGRTVNAVRTFASPRIAMDWLCGIYREPMWDDMECELQVWLEKTALEGVIESITDVYDVPLFAAKGFSSVTFLNDAAEMMSRDKPVHILYLADADASGTLAMQTVERTLREMAPYSDIHFHQLALTPAQALAWPGGALPSRPSKESAHSKALNWQGDSWELDAIPPNELRMLVREAIRAYMPDVVWHRLRADENDRKTKMWQAVADLFPHGGEEEEDTE